MLQDNKGRLTVKVDAWDMLKLCELASGLFFTFVVEVAVFILKKLNASACNANDWVSPKID